MPNVRAYSPVTEPQLYPFIFDHNTVSEGSRIKCHISDFDKTNERTLCGLGTESSGTATTHRIDETWLLLPDPEHGLCLTCKRIALKQYLKWLENV